MKIRRIASLILFAIVLAGAFIWLSLRRENALGNSPAVAKNFASANVGPDVRESENIVRTADSSTASAVRPTKLDRPTRTQIDPNVPKRFLSEEARLITNNQLNEDAAKNMLRSPRFDDFVQRMPDEMAGNTAAKDVADLYVAAVQNDLADMRGLTMGQFACGATLCVGSIDAEDDSSSWDQWTKKFDDNQNAPTYVFIDTPVDRGNGVTQHRIVFSTDPDSNSVTGAL